MALKLVLRLVRLERRCVFGFAELVSSGLAAWKREGSARIGTDPPFRGFGLVLSRRTRRELDDSLGLLISGRIWRQKRDTAYLRDQYQSAMVYTMVLECGRSTDMTRRMTEMPRLILKISRRTWSLTSGTNGGGSPGSVAAMPAPRSSAAKKAVGTSIASTLRRLSVFNTGGHMSDVSDLPYH